MDSQTIVAYCVVAALAILSPGPAVLLALRNGVSFGMQSAVWSSLGNVTGIFLLSSAAMLGLGALLKSSAVVFEAVKLLGALYLFYLGIRHIFGRSRIDVCPGVKESESAPRPHALYWEAFWLAATNPKPILFFSALFPQFLKTSAPLLPQFFLLTGIFIALSFAVLLGYAAVARRTRTLLLHPRVAAWTNRVVGAAFVSFGALLLTLRRPSA